MNYKGEVPAKRRGLRQVHLAPRRANAKLLGKATFQELLVAGLVRFMGAGQRVKAYTRGGSSAKMRTSCS